MLSKLIDFFLRQRLLTLILLAVVILWGLIHSPFSRDSEWLPSAPVSVDAIPDLGENQQIVYAKWQGQSPQDVEDQLSFPLSSYLMGIAGVKTVRSNSMFGFSSIYVIFEEDIDFYWSRSRILEKLNSLPEGLLPEGVKPQLGPDATALGQVYWYTLEARDQDGKMMSHWDLHELRSVQDFYVKYALNSVQGVSEVASIGGYTQEFLVEPDPDLLEQYDLSIMDLANAVRASNEQSGAKTMEINQAEYLIRGLGFVEDISALEQALVSYPNETPIRVKDVARVSLAPGERRGILDKSGAEVVGGVVVVRYGANPMEVINRVKSKIDEISSGLPRDTLDDGRIAHVEIVPFYDRSGLINETIGTLEEALLLEILISILVILLMVFNLRASFMIGSILPVGVLICFIAMYYFQIDANIVALSGIAIAIGTMVDLGIILSENILKKLEEEGNASLFERIRSGSQEVAPAILTAVLTTTVSFIPVFTMEATEGKLFRPLAFTKSFALIAAFLITVIFIPTLTYFSYKIKFHKGLQRHIWPVLLAVVGIVMIILGFNMGWILLLFLLILFINRRTDSAFARQLPLIVVLLTVAWLLADLWLPLGPEKSRLMNLTFVVLLLGGILGTLWLFLSNYRRILMTVLSHKKAFLGLCAVIIFFGFMIWIGFSTLFKPVQLAFNPIGIEIEESTAWKNLDNKFPGIGEEFMPALDEGSFLLMPTTLPHAGVTENKKLLQQLDILVAQIPEVESVVGKAGRVESALDPAPLSMFENVVLYKTEYVSNDDGHAIRFKRIDDGRFVLSTGDSLNADSIRKADLQSALIPDSRGEYFRNWRDEIEDPDDIWEEIVRKTRLPGLTSAPKLQPIETRLVMLQSGMRAPMGIKVYGPNLKTLERFGMKLENVLKAVDGVKAQAVFAERIVGKPYLEVAPRRDALAQYGLTVKAFNDQLSLAFGGKVLGYSISGRERYPISLRLPRELRHNVEDIRKFLIVNKKGTEIPLGQLSDVRFERGPQSIKSENSFLTSYVLFDKIDGFAEVEVIENAQKAIEDAIASGELSVPQGVSYSFTGTYENQVRAAKRLSIVVPLVLILVFLILYFQFRSAGTSLMVFSGILLAFSGGFIMLWLYGQDWFLNFSFFGAEMRELFSVQSISLSVAVWVGFIALFGIATDDGVLVATYLDQQFKREEPKTKAEIQKAVLHAGQKRIRPALMTVATTLIALLPILSSDGKGSDIMVPMAIPAFGGMCMALLSVLLVPTLYAMRAEYLLKRKNQSDE